MRKLPRVTNQKGTCARRIRIVMSKDLSHGEAYMAQHVKVLGILHIVFGGLCVLGGLIAFAVMGGIAGIVNASDQSQDSAVAVPILAMIGAFVCVLCLVVGVPGLVGGFGLLQFRPWARITVI